MNEQRRDAYLTLINALLACPSGEEGKILQDNAELVDAGLLETMVRVVLVLTERGDEQGAQFLTEIASQLGTILGLTSSRPNPDVQLDFLKQVLKTILETQANAQVIDALLQKNLHLLDENFAQVLYDWGQLMRAELKAEQAQNLALVIGEFSNLIEPFSGGNEANNLEIAIAGYQVALTLLTRDQNPETWATLHHNLGTAYRNRIRGERAENIERAIASYQAALEISTREAFPTDWASTQNNLGLAYSSRIRGELAENIEWAIASFEAALQVYSRDGFPRQWARTHYNLGNALVNRIQDE
jgi:tetratricopeptide (TPR) repeat protein